MFGRRKEGVSTVPEGERIWNSMSPEMREATDRRLDPPHVRARIAANVPDLMGYSRSEFQDWYPYLLQHQMLLIFGEKAQEITQNNPIILSVRDADPLDVLTEAAREVSEYNLSKARTNISRFPQLAASKFDAGEFDGNNQEVLLGGFLIGQTLLDVLPGEEGLPFDTRISSYRTYGDNLFTTLEGYFSNRRDLVAEGLFFLINNVQNDTTKASKRRFK